MDIVFAWIASISTGLEPLIIKATSRRQIKDPWLFNVLWLAISAPFIVLFALIRGGGMPADWFTLLLASATAAGFYVLYTLSIYKLDVTTLAPLFSLRTVFAVILGVLFLGETVSALGTALIVLIILASPLASYDEHLRLKAFLNKYVLLAVFAMLVLALEGYFVNRSAAANGFATTILWQDILSLLMLLPTLALANLDKERVTRKKLLPFVALGVTGFIYRATTTVAYAHNLALSSVIVSLPFSMVFAYLVSRRRPDMLENHPPRVYAMRFAGTAVMITAAIWLSFL